jgi:hypothetical protein
MMFSFIAAPSHAFVPDASPIGTAAALTPGILHSLALDNFADKPGEEPFQQ